MLFKIYCVNLFFYSTVNTYFFLEVFIFYFKDKVTFLIVSYNILIIHLKYNVVNNRFVLKVIYSLTESIHFSVL